MAQLVEHLLAKERVAGSSPVSRSWLHKKRYPNGYLFFVQAEPDRALHPRAGIEVSAHIKWASVGAGPGAIGPRAPSRAP